MQRTLALVLRLDLGYRFHRREIGLYGLPTRDRGPRFVDCCFGLNH